jgi:hypothetical protein
MSACITVVLAAALAGLPAGTCTLQCEIRKAVVFHDDSGWGIASMQEGIWFEVQRVDGRWLLVLEQEPRQCRDGQP